MSIDLKTEQYIEDLRAQVDDLNGTPEGMNCGNPLDVSGHY